MTTEAAVCATFPVGRYSCTLTLGPAGALCEWQPDLPPRNGLTAEEIKQYKAGRAKLLDEFVARFGAIAVVDI